MAVARTEKKKWFVRMFHRIVGVAGTHEEPPVLEPLDSLEPCPVTDEVEEFHTRIRDLTLEVQKMTESGTEWPPVENHNGKL